MSASTSFAAFPTTEAPQAAPEPQTRAARLSGWPLTVLAGLAAALPVIVTASRAIARGWVPLADQGTIAARAYEVLGSHTPLVGQYSFASRAVGKVTYDPGPMLYWLLALPARFGGAAAITAVMAAFNILAIVGAVALARRRGGTALMLMSAFAIALMSRSFGSEALHGIWNPSAALFALTLLCFVCWSVACGEHWLLPLAAALASFVIQCHLAYVAPALALMLVAIVGLALVVRARRRLAPREEPDMAMRRRIWRVGLARSLLATVLVVLACWSAPLVDQVEHSPGNLSLLASAATASHATEGADVGWRALTHAVGLPPRFATAPTRAVDGTGAGADSSGALSGGDYGDTRLGDVLRAPSTLALVSCALAIVGLIALGALALRRRRREIAIAAAIGVLLSAAFTWNADATPVQDLPTLGYTLWWGSLVGMWVWLTLIWGCWELLAPRAAAATAARTRGMRRSRTPAHAALGLAIAAVIVCGAAIAAGEPADAHQPEFHAASELSAALARDAPAGTHVVLAEHGLAVVPIVPALRYALQRHGADVAPQLGRYADLRAASSATGAGLENALLAFVSEGPSPEPPGGGMHASVHVPRAPWLPGATSAHTLVVAMLEGAGLAAARGG